MTLPAVIAEEDVRVVFKDCVLPMYAPLSESIESCYQKIIPYVFGSIFQLEIYSSYNI